MQARVKNYEKRIVREIEEKEDLLSDIERPVELKLHPLVYEKDILFYARSFSAGYRLGERVLSELDFELRRGERVALHGKNGCGKSTLIKAVLQRQEQGNPAVEGEFRVGAGLIISYVDQDTGFLQGSLKEFCSKRMLDESLFFALLRQLDMERAQFTKPIEEFSEGQKKKVLIAASLMTPAHLYVWDEPLNYIDVFTRMQIESLLLKYQPTMLFVDHDIRFREKIATRVLELP